jgi:hypothetical protein
MGHVPTNHTVLFPELCTTFIPLLPSSTITSKTGRQALTNSSLAAQDTAAMDGSIGGRTPLLRSTAVSKSTAMSKSTYPPRAVFVGWRPGYGLGPGQTQISDPANDLQYTRVDGIISLPSFLGRCWTLSLRYNHQDDRASNPADMTNPDLTTRCAVRYGAQDTHAPTAPARPPRCVPT